MDGSRAEEEPPPGPPRLDGHYFTFRTGGDPGQVVERFEARTCGNRVTYYRNGPVGSRAKVNSATANSMESYEIRGNQLIGTTVRAVATVDPQGDILHSYGHTSRKEAFGPARVVENRVNPERNAYDLTAEAAFYV